MSDLISRKAFMEYLGLEDTEENREENVGEIVTLEDFDRQATAFDKEKVMEKLKHCRDYYDVNEQPKKPFDYWECADIRERKGKWMAYDDAIEIVEKGGIE